MNRRYLFVCGCARSGTSLVTDLLTMHEEIAIGMERYQRLVTERPEAFESSLFDEERFFAPRPGDTFYDDLTSMQHYQRLVERYAHATYVGDKVPRLSEHYALLAERFPGARIVFVSRDLPAVAASFKARAADSGDTLWPSDRGVAAAVRQWTRAYRDTRRALEISDVFVLRFEALTSGADTAPLLDYLGLPMTKDFRRMLAWIDRSAQERLTRRNAAADRRFDASELALIEDSGHEALALDLERAAAARGRLL